MTDPVVYLEAELARREALARAATPGPWVPKDEDPADDEVYTTHDGEHGDLVGDPVAYVRGGYGRDPGDPAANINLIATMADPVDVLRRIAADRKALALHEPVPNHGRFSGRDCVDDGCDGDHWRPPVCRTCRNYAGDPVEAPCDSLELLAGGYGWTG